MKKILLFFFLCIGALALPNLLNAQCTSANAGCNMAAGQYDNVVIGEVSGDAGQSDGANDAIVEIVGPPGTDIGCMVITDTEWAVLIPAGTVIPADGVFSLGCLNGMGTGVGITGGTNGLIAGGIGDFNAGLPIDFDVCDAANAAYYDPAASGFTLDNTGGPGSLNGDGEQVFLFLPDGTPHDGVYWDGGGTGTADHVSASMGIDYTLGDNDGNGIANDVATTVGGGRGDGGNATAVPILPTGDGTECACNNDAAPGIFTVPGIGGASDDNGLGGSLWTQIQGTDHVGCNSSFIRLTPGTSAGGSDGSSNASHTDGEIESSGMDATGQNLDNGGGATGGTTSEGFDPAAFTPAACGDASAEWAYTDHPTPGEANDDPTFVFFADQTVLCAPAAVTFMAEVYNWQHVEDMITSTNQGNGKTGSYVIDETGTQVAWASITPAGETTTLTYTSGVLPVGIHTFTLVWDDWTDCCGTGGLSTVNECYESEIFTITVAEPFTLSSTDVACPGDFAPGFVDISTLIATGGTSPLNYDLQYAGVSEEINGSGLFNIVTAATDPITVVVSDPTGCTPPVTVNIEAACKAAPPCPEITASMIDDADGVICPGDQVCFDITGFDNLPEGGTIDFYSDVTNTFDPYQGEGTLLGTAAITVTGPTCPADGFNLIISELGDPQSGFRCNRYIEVTNVGPCDATQGNLAGFAVDAYGENVVVETWDLSTLAGGIPAGSSVLLAGTGSTLAGVDLAEMGWHGANCTSGGAGTSGNSNGQLDDGAILYNVGGDIDVVRTGATSGNLYTDGILIRNDDVCMGNTTYDSAEWMLMSGSDVSNAGTHTTTCIMPGGTTVAQFCQTFDAAYCNLSGNGDFFVKAIINPFSDFDDPADLADCFSTDADRFETFMLNMSCPEAILVPTTQDVCLADLTNENEVTINLAGLAAGNYFINYEVNGVAATTSVAGGTATATITLPAPTTGEQKVVITSIFNDIDASGTQEAGECSGTFTNAEVCVNIRPMSTIEITASTDPTTCTPADGTFTITGPAGVLFDIDYTSGTLAGVTLPQTVMNLGPGTYTITGATDEGGCPVTVNGAGVTLVAPDASTVSATNPAPICGADAPIDLSTLAVLDGLGTDGGTLTYYGVDPRVVPGAPALGSSMISTTGTYYIAYDEGGCISYAEVNITVNPDPIATTDFLPANCSGNGLGQGVIDVNIMVSDGTPGYMISGLGVTNQAQATDGTAVLTPSATTPSTVTIVDANGCMTTVDLSTYTADCLPVELTNFAGEYLDEKVKLTWNTSSELNNSHFVVERSLDGTKFVELDKVDGAGTTLEPQSYSYFDLEPKRINYYRLKQVDYDGTYEYTIVVVVNANRDNLGTKVFPVPTKETLVVETTRDINNIEVMDITGRIVKVSNFDTTRRVELNVSELAAGTYFVSVKAERGVEMIRFIKK